MHKNIITHNDKILFQLLFKHFFLGFLNENNDLLIGLLNEFQINVNIYKRIRREFSRDYLFDFGKDEKGLLGNAALGFLFYEIVSDIFDQKDFKQRIDKLVLREKPELKNIDERKFLEEIGTYDLTSTNTYFFLHYLCNTGLPLNIKLGFYEEDLGVQLVDSLGLEDIERIEEHPIYKKYEKRQIETVLEKFGEDPKADPIVLYRNFARLTDSALSISRNSRDVVAYRFGYHFGENEIDSFHNNLDFIESIVKEEIKKYLLDELDAACYEDNPLKISQIIRLAGIKNVDSFIKEVCLSCEEYFYIREIAYAQRQWVFELVFGKKEATESKNVSSDSEELKALQLKNDELNQKNHELETQIEKIRVENESLKGSLANKQKAFDAELRSLREENNKAIKQQKRANIKLLSDNAVLMLMLKIVTSQEHEDDLLIPYDLERIQKKRIFVLGGREEVRRELEKLIPQAVFIKDENQQIPTGKCDCIFIFHEYFNHATFYKYINYARKNDIPVGYTPSTNMERVLSDLYATIIRLDELKIPDFIIKD